MFADWTLYFWPQITSPWTLTQGVFNLPWFFLALQIVRPLGKWGALIVVQAMGLYVVLRLCHQLRLSTWRIVLLALSPPVILGAAMGQVDTLILAAYLLPPWASIFFALCKPQVAITAGIAAMVRQPWTILLAICLVASAYLVWSWPLACEKPPLGGPTTGTWWDWSCWPWGLLLLPLIRSRRGRLFLSPFLSPYAGVQSLTGPLLAVPGWLFLPLWAGMWIRWMLVARLI